MQTTITLTPTVLKSSDAFDLYYPFLEDDLKDYARELMHESTILNDWDHDYLADSMTYSLSYSQGDGVAFSGGSISIEREDDQDPIQYFVVKPSNHSLHFFVDHENGSESTANEYTMELKEIAYKIEKHGYSIIESNDQDNINFLAFERFKNTNGIEWLEDLYEYEYTNSAKEVPGYTLVATSGDTNIDGLWVQLPPLKEHTKETNYFTFA